MKINYYIWNTQVKEMNRGKKSILNSQKEELFFFFWQCNQTWRRTLTFLRFFLELWCSCRSLAECRCSLCIPCRILGAFFSVFFLGWGFNGHLFQGKNQLRNRSFEEKKRRKKKRAVSDFMLIQFYIFISRRN